MALVFPDGSYTNNNYPRPFVPGGQKPTGSTPRKPTGQGGKPVPPRQRPVGPSTKGQVPPSTKRQEPGTRAAAPKRAATPVSVAKAAGPRAGAPKRPATPVAKTAGTRKDAGLPVPPRVGNKARPDDRIISKGDGKKVPPVRKNPNRPEGPSAKTLRNRPENDTRVARAKAPAPRRGKGPVKGIKKID